MYSISLIIISILFFSVPSFALTEKRTITTRAGVTLEFLYMTPDTGTTRNVLILFTGGNGAVPYRITPEGAVYGWNFLVRSADEFTRRGLSVIAVNSPSDHQTGMSSGFRESSEHAQDIAKLADYLKLQGFERIFLVGNSRGTISAASVAARIQNSNIKGAVLTSTLEFDNFMSFITPNTLRLPILMIHHREDNCRVSLFGEAEKTRDILKTYTTVDFVEVDGGSFYARSAPCNDLSAHGFFGIEQKVAQVIADWIDGRKIPQQLQ